MGLTESVVGEKPRRPLVLAAIDDAVIGAVLGAEGLNAELNSPNPSEALLALRTTRGGGAVCFGGAGFGGGFGPVSKNPPPASGGGIETCGGLEN